MATAPTVDEPVLSEPVSTINPTQPMGIMDDATRRVFADAFKARDATPKPDKPSPDATKPEPEPVKPVTTQPKAVEPATKPAAPELPPTDKFVPGKTKAADWERIKNERDAANRRVAELESASKKPINSDELNALRKERDELSNRLRLVAIERDPRFEAEFNSASKVVLDTARSAIGLAKAEAAETILKMPPSESRDAATEKFLEGVPSWKQTQFSYALAEMDKLRAMKDARVSESITNWNRIQEEGRLKLENERASVVSKLDELISKWQSPDFGIPVWQHREGDAEWNGKVDQSISLAKEILAGDMDESGMVDAAARAASYHLLVESLQAEMTKSAELEAEIARLKGISPGAGPSGDELQPRGPADDVDVPEGTSYATALAMKARALNLLP